MKKVKGVNLSELFERDDIKSKENFSLIKTALELEKQYIRCMLDDYSKEVLNEIVEIVANEIMDERVRATFLKCTSRYLYSVAVFSNGLFTDNDTFQVFLQTILDATKATREHVIINGTYIYDGDYVFVEGQKPESLLKVSEFQSDSILFTDMVSKESICINYDELIETLDAEKTSLYYAASIPMIRGNIYIWLYESNIKDVINNYSAKISDDHVKTKFINDCVAETIKFRNWSIDFVAVEVISAIQKLWQEYNLDKPSITVGDKTYYIGSYVVMNDMDCKYDTIISNIENGIVSINNKFNPAKNTTSYTVEEFKDKVFSSYEIFSNPNYKYAKEDFPMLLLAHSIYPTKDRTEKKKGKGNKSDNPSAIYIEASEELLRYRIEDIPDKKRAKYYVDRMLSILNKTHIGYKGIWDSLSLIELFDYEWYKSPISQKSIYLVGDFFYPDDTLGIKGYSHHDPLEIKSITDDEIMIGKRYHPELYTETFKSPEDLEKLLLTIEDVYSIEKLFKEDKSLLDNSAVVSKWIDVFSHTTYNYRFDTYERDYIEKLSSKIRNEYLNHHIEITNSLNDDELLISIIDYLTKDRPEILDIDINNKKEIQKYLTTKVINLHYKGIFGPSVLHVSFSKTQAIVTKRSNEVRLTLKLNKFTDKLIEILAAKKELSQEMFSETDYSYHSEEHYNYDYTENNNSESDVKDEDIDLDYTDDIALDDSAVSILEYKDADLSKESVLSGLVSHIYESNQCELVNLKSIKNTISFIKGCCVSDEVRMDTIKVDVKKDILKQVFICAILDKEFTFKFRDIATELINLKNSLVVQLDIFAMLG